MIQNQPIRSAFDSAQHAWDNVIKNPDNYLCSYPDRFYAAMGQGVTLFGGKNSLWTALQNKAAQNGTNIAGVDFSMNELKLLGDFYRSLGRTGICIDERVAMEKNTNAESGIHEHCGAAAAIGQVIGKQGFEVENEAMKLLDYSQKQLLLPGTEGGHESLTVFIDPSEQAFGLRPEVKETFLKQNALAFQFSFPLQSIRSFLDVQKLPPEKTLYSALLKWNIQIAINIINGHHNKFYETAKTNGVLFVLDRRNAAIDDNPIATNTYEEFVNALKIQQPVVELSID